jgi:hypothetical protein
MSHPTRSIHAQAGLHRKLVLFGAQLELYLAHFPSHHKYVMAQQLRQAYLDVYNLVTEAQKRYHKRTTLSQLDVRHEQLRMLLLLAHELGLFNFSKGKQDAEQPGEHRALVMLRLVDELGRMIGGWLQKESAPGGDAQGPLPAVAAAAQESGERELAGAVGA